MGGFEDKLERLTARLRDAMEDLPDAEAPTLHITIGENRGLVQTGPVHITISADGDNGQNE